jgi:hypothetical protein
MRTTPDNITKLEHNQIFVFGSNTWGVHGKGAAKVARDLFGAQKGVAEGRTGQCYAIPTRKYIPRDEAHWKVRFEAVPLVEIHRSIHRFFDYATLNPQLEFLVTKIGCGYAGYDVSDFTDIFSRELVPLNVILPAEFQSH